MHRIVDSRCVLAVRNLDGSSRFYVDVLGFQRDFGDGSDGWCFLSRDAFKVMLGECPDEKPASELGTQSLGNRMTGTNVFWLVSNVCSHYSYFGED